MRSLFQSNLASWKRNLTCLDHYLCSNIVYVAPIQKLFIDPKIKMTSLFLSGAQSLIPNQTNTSWLFCGAIIHLGPLFCLVFRPRELFWDPFYFSFILTMSQGTLPLAQNSLRMIWRCMGYWGTLTKMWKNYRKILLVWNIGEMIGNWDLTLINAKWCIFLKRMTIQALNYLCGNNLKAVSEVEDLRIHITSNLLPYHLLNADTPLIWTLSMAPSVSIEMGFDRTPCLVPSCLKCGKQKTWQHEPSRSIMQWTMGTFSMDAKDAGKDEQQKFALRLSHDT